MAEQWEAIFRNLAEGTHAITEIILNANEGDDLEPGYKVLHSAELPSSHVGTANNCCRRSSKSEMRS